MQCVCDSTHSATITFTTLMNVKINVMKTLNMKITNLNASTPVSESYVTACRDVQGVAIEIETYRIQICGKAAECHKHPAQSSRPSANLCRSISMNMYILVSV